MRRSMVLTLRVSDPPLSKYAWMAIFRKLLPEDAKISDCMIEDGLLRLRIDSETYDEVPEGHRLPLIYGGVTFDDAEAEKDRAVSPVKSCGSAGPAEDAEIWDKCYCQLEYTGETQHRHQCPFARR